MGSGSSSSGSGSAELEATYFAMGILLAFIGNVGLNVGTNLIALGHDQKAKGRTIGKEWVGPSGLALYILGACVSFSSWAFGSQIVIAAFGSVQFVSNVFCARLFFGMPVTGKVVLSTLMIVVGNVLVILPPYISGVGGGHPSAVTGDPPGAEMLFVSSERAAHLLFVVAAIGWSFFPLGSSHLLSLPHSLPLLFLSSSLRASNKCRCCTASRASRSTP